MKAALRVLAENGIGEIMLFLRKMEGNQHNYSKIDEATVTIADIEAALGLGLGGAKPPKIKPFR
ncbi:MAG: hypothetical protein FWF18_05780 [Dehalococcoidia bacterium]|nr:hypothetical protein [Dehalococcoidia bacterium]